jgi:hypothetical protein
MEYQQLPPVSTMQQLGQPPAPSPSPHLQIMQNVINPNLNTSQNNNQNTSSSQLLTTMQPPILPLGMPLQVVHNLQQLTGNTNNSNNNNNNNTPNNNNNNPNTPNNNHHNSQNLPPPSQLLQSIHHSQQANNNNNNTPNGTTHPQNHQNGNTIISNQDGNRWTQYAQVQQLWRHHAYLNGKQAFRAFSWAWSRVL